MAMGTEQQIRERAYAIWLAAGGGNGMADAHWFDAERMISAEAQSAASIKAKSKVVKSTKRAPAAAAAKTASAKAARTRRNVDAVGPSL